MTRVILYLTFLFSQSTCHYLSSGSFHTHQKPWLHEGCCSGWNFPVSVLKNLIPELFPTLAKLFNNCMKEKCFLSLCKLPAICLAFMNTDDNSSPLQYYALSASLLHVISKHFESIINKETVNHLTRKFSWVTNSMGFTPIGQLQTF